MINMAKGASGLALSATAKNIASHRNSALVQMDSYGNIVTMKSIGAPVLRYNRTTDKFEWGLEDNNGTQLITYRGVKSTDYKTYYMDVDDNSRWASYNAGNADRYNKQNNPKKIEITSEKDFVNIAKAYNENFNSEFMKKADEYNKKKQRPFGK